MNIKKSFIKTKQNIKIALYNFHGTGKPIIFCHFTGGLGRLWAPVIKHLPLCFNCFSYDARGHGISSKPIDFSLYSWEYHLEDLISVIREVKKNSGANNFYGVGHSFGGAILTQAVLATKGFVNWERIILIEPIIAPQSVDIKKTYMSAIAKKRKGIFESTKALRDTLRTKNPYKNWTEESWLFYEKFGFIKTKTGIVKLKCTPEIESYQYLHANPPGWFENLKKIDIPTYLMYGEKSDLIPLANHQIMQLKNGYLIKLPNVGHFLPQENPKLLASWISKLFGH